MIRIQGNSFPLFYQVENSHALPSAVGAVQWNGMSKCFEVSTQTGWARIDPTIEITMNYNVVETIKWAEKKMNEEKEMLELARSNPAIADLMNQIEEKKQQIKVIKNLVG